jgi:hypothetical protein
MTIQSGSQTKHPVGRIGRNIEILLMYVGHLITLSSCTPRACEFPVLLAGFVTGYVVPVLAAG